MSRRTAFPECGRIRCGAAIASVVIALASSVAVAEDEPAIDGNAELADLLASAKQYEIRLTRSNAVLEFREPSLLNFTNPVTLHKVYNSFHPRNE